MSLISSGEIFIVSSGSFREIGNEEISCFCDRSLHRDFCDEKTCSVISWLYFFIFLLIAFIAIMFLYYKIKKTKKEKKKPILCTLLHIAVGCLFLAFKQLLQILKVESDRINSIIYLVGILAVGSSYMWIICSWITYFSKNSTKNEIFSLKFQKYTSIYKFINIIIIVVWYVFIIIAVSIYFVWKITNIVILIYIGILAVVFFAMGLHLQRKKRVHCQLAGFDSAFLLPLNRIIIFSYIFVILCLIAFIIILVGTLLNTSDSSSKTIFSLHRFIILLFTILPLVITKKKGIIVLKIINAFNMNNETIDNNKEFRLSVSQGQGGWLKASRSNNNLNNKIGNELNSINSSNSGCNNILNNIDSEPSSSNVNTQLFSNLSIPLEPPLPSSLPPSFQEINHLADLNTSTNYLNKSHNSINNEELNNDNNYCNNNNDKL